VRPSHLYDVALRAALGVVEADETPEVGARAAADVPDRERAPVVPLSALFRTR
jgi:hypothetical protein